MSILLASVLALAQGGAAANAVTLGIGSDAPAFIVEKWVRGTPVKNFERDKVYVVEFWATWCGPCIGAMPHLSDLSEKYKGKAQFVGVNVWDRQDDEKTNDNAKQLKRITDFMNEKKKEMRYDVAIDGPDDYMSKNWLFAAGQNGIPSSFIVGKDGKIAWIGHPMGMDEPLEKIVAGTWDVEAAKKEFAEAAEKQKKMMEAMKAWSKQLADAATANDLRGFYEIVPKGPYGESFPVYAGIQQVASTHPTFALRAAADKVGSIGANTIAGICVYAAGSKVATDADKAKAEEMAIAAGNQAPDALKAETYGMIARVFIAVKKNDEARVAIKKARAGLEKAAANQKAGLTQFVNDVEKMIKD